MAELYPLLFAPIFKERVWGGRRLSQWFSHLPEGSIGEAWVLSDHPQGPTPVSNGPLAGETLRSLRERFGAALVGTRGTSEKTGEFPLLFKMLDCQDDLSVQVHPSDAYAGLPPGELGKTEMWVVLDAAPGAKAVYGLKEGVTAASFAEAVRAGRTMDVMNQVEVQAGDVLYVPAGTVHALGTGLLVAEIQQSSDTTYRIYDYDRPGLDGKPRELHIDHALQVSRYGPPPRVTRAEAKEANAWQEICRSPFFTVYHGRCEGAWAQGSKPDSFQAFMVLQGEGSIAWAGGSEPLRAGATVLVPASLGAYQLAGTFQALLVTV